MRTIKAASVVSFAVAVIVFLAGQRVQAAGQSLEFRGSDSGTVVSVPLDIDADSCTTTVGVTTCTDLSAYGNTAGKQSGGIEAGEFTAGSCAWGLRENCVVSNRRPPRCRAPKRRATYFLRHRLPKSDRNPLPSPEPDKVVHVS
jgi:hypothetical protein